MAESMTRDWVEQQNVEHGIAPSALEARACYDQVRRGSTAEGRDAPSAQAARQWTRRWQKRWAAKRGKLRRQEPLAPGLILEKVAQLHLQRALGSGRKIQPKRVQFLDPFSGLTFYYRAIKRPRKWTRFLGLLSGPSLVLFLLIFLRSVSFFECPFDRGPACKQRQVTAYWKWLRYTESRGCGGKKLLRINLDETSVSFGPEMRSGLIVVRSSQAARSLVRKQDTRTNITYVAVICDEPALQEAMPHFIIGSASNVTLAQMAGLKQTDRRNVHIWRNQQKAWNNHFLMQRILAKISESVAHRQDVQPVVIVDCAPCHIHKAVLQKARSLGIWLIFVPSYVTSLLQPLDTHGFASFKSWLRQQYSALRAKVAGGKFDRLEWLRVLQSAKDSFFSQKEWSHSFEDTGARPYCQRLTTELLKYVQPTAARTAAPEQPSAQMLSLFWPRNRSVADAHDVLFNLPMPSVPSHVSVQPAAVKRPLAQAAMSIALASRQHKRACRQFPSRPA